MLRHNLGNGHTCLPADKLIPTAAAMLGVEEEPVRQTAEEMAETFDLKAADIGGRRFLFLPHLYQAEKFIASRIGLMANFPPLENRHIEENIDAAERASGVKYEVRQREAIRQAVEKGVLILTGGPGTGKTTTLKAIIAVLEEMGEEVAVTAPTPVVPPNGSRSLPAVKRRPFTACSRCSGTTPTPRSLPATRKTRWTRTRW